VQGVEQAAVVGKAVEVVVSAVGALAGRLRRAGAGGGVAHGDRLVEGGVVLRFAGDGAGSSAIARIDTGPFSHSQLYKEFEESPSFKRWLEDRLFGITYQPPTTG